MKTSKPFATISYNSIDFLTTKLNDLFNAGEIEFYAFIKHYAEGLVDGTIPETKDHIHLFIIPSGITNTIELKDYFKELDPTNDLPLSIINCVSSKFYDWFYYSLHDSKYLAMKFEERKYHYKLDDFHTSDFDYLGQLLAMNDNNKLNNTEKISNLIKAGLTWEDLVSSGFIPVQLINHYKEFYRITFHSIQKNIKYENTDINLSNCNYLGVVDGKHNKKVF